MFLPKSFEQNIFYLGFHKGLRHAACSYNHDFHIQLVVVAENFEVVVFVKILWKNKSIKKLNPIIFFRFLPSWWNRSFNFGFAFFRFFFFIFRWWFSMLFFRTRISRTMSFGLFSMFRFAGFFPFIFSARSATLFTIFLTGIRIRCGIVVRIGTRFGSGIRIRLGTQTQRSRSGATFARFALLFAAFGIFLALFARIRSFATATGVFFASRPRIGAFTAAFCWWERLRE